MSKENEEVSKKIALFGKLPGQCSSCGAKFDKRDKHMAKTWRVDVYGENVRLYCLNCQLNKKNETKRVDTNEESR